MNARVIAFIASRLLALYVLLNYGFIFIMELIISVVQNQRQYALFHLIVSAFDIAASGVLWLKANWISDQLTKSAPEISNGGLTIDNWKAFCVAAIGAAFLFTGMKFVGGGLKTFFEQETNLSINPELLPFLIVSSLLYFVIGIALIAWTHKIVRGLNDLYIWINRPFINENEQ